MKRITLSEIATARGLRRAATLVTAWLIGSFLLFSFWPQPMSVWVILWGFAFLGAILWLMGLPKRWLEREPRPTDESDLVAQRTSLSRSMLDLVSYPVLLVNADERVIGSNRMARVRFRGLGDNVPLISVLRSPEIHDALSEVLHGGRASADVRYQIAGSDEEYVRALFAGVDLGDFGRCAMLELHDDSEAQRAMRARSGFLANASHELRTPLASLSGFIETLRGHARDDPAARDHFLSIMSDQAERMRRLIDDLLSLSRIEQNEHVAPRGKHNLLEIIHDVRDSLRPQASAHVVTLEAFDDAGGLAIIGDRDEVVQVIQNLLDNAIKYAPASSEITVKVESALSRTQARAAPGFDDVADAPGVLLVAPSDQVEEFVGVMIRDRGNGIPRANLPQLAHRFFRVTEGRAKGPSGTGLGLAIVKHVMMRHRGSMSVASMEGLGTAFRVCFPLARRAQDTALPDAREKAVAP
jgi:two-component system phosphate regulon sensor histidine kinase PhoR